MNAYIARQPIFDRDRTNLGYELFYRDSSGKSTYGRNGDDATRRVMTDAATLFDFQELTHGRAYITFTPNLILDDFVRNADPEKVVVQLMADRLRIDQRMEDKLRALRDAGYFLALKNYDGQSGQSALRPYLNLFDIIRVNFARTTSALRKEIRYNHGAPGMGFMADRIENADAAYDAFRWDYDFFQGNFFGKTELIDIPIPTLIETAYGQILLILAHVRHNVQWDDGKCARIIEGHPLLSYLFLREMKAVVPPPNGTKVLGQNAEDIAYAARYLGPPTMRHWICLAYMRYNNITDNDDLPRRAYLRGLFMEELAKTSTLDVDVDGGNVFLLGILSMIETIVGESPAYLLRDLKARLFGGAENGGAYTALLRYATYHERPDSGIVLSDIGTHLDGKQISGLYRMCERDAEAAVARMDTSVS